jgi:acetyltransferase (GNAT) family protein
VTVREATLADGPALIELFRQTPLDAGTAFVLDRGPDFWALLALRGDHRTFVACEGDRVAGTATALWHDAGASTGPLRVGEIVDLRIATWARGTRAALRLLEAVRGALLEARIGWALCLVGDRNDAARTLVAGKAGFPRLGPLTRWASVHFVTLRAPRRLPSGLEVRPATDVDRAALLALAEHVAARRQLVPLPLLEWPDPRHRAWLALERGAPVGALVAWSGEGVRALRIVRHRWQDAPLRALVATASLAGLSPPLPGPGGVLRMWATRWVAAPPGRPAVGRALVRFALRAAAAEGVQVLQVNLPEGDPLLGALPALPRSTYWSTLYGCPCGDGPTPPTPPPTACHHADVALV